jgi:hypothetical protein
MKTCSKCVLPDTFPGISFNEEGVCNHCQRFESFSATAEEKLEYQVNLDLACNRYALSMPYGTHILMAYSGGKDSTYSLRLFVEKYGANVLAFTFDNGFISHQAWENIKTVCDALGVRHLIIRHPQDMIDNLIRHATDNEMYSEKTMERASTICTMCSGFFKSAAIAYALENNIPMIGYGWSPGQAPIQSAFTQTNPRFVRLAQKNIIKPVIEVIGEGARRYFLSERHYAVPAEKWPISVHPLAFEDYDEEAIKDDIRELGWVNPTDVDTNSTNCTLNAFANQLHIDRYGFHPYVQEIANMVRQGSMSREEALEKIYSEQNPKLVEYAKNRLDIE